MVDPVFDKVAKFENIKLIKLPLVQLFIDFIAGHGNIIISSFKDELKTLTFL